MREITFKNAGYNIAELPNLTFHWPLSNHAFLYFQGAVRLNGKDENSGACVLYTAGTMHDYTTQRGFVNSYIGFTAPSELFEKLSIEVNKVIYPDNCKEINEILREICNEDAKRAIGYELRLSALIEELLVAIARGTNNEEERRNDREFGRIAAVRNEYLRNLANVPDIVVLAAENGISRTQLYKLYAKYFHTSPKCDLTVARMERVRDMIRHDPEKKIYEIASECGFGDIPNFFRLFKKRYGYTPKEYAAAALSERENCTNGQ